MKRAGIVLGLIAALAGCTHVPLGSIIPLTRIKFGSTEFSRVRAAIKLPDSVRPRPRGVRMTVTVSVGGEPPQSYKFNLVETRDPEDQAALAAFVSAGSIVYAYRLSPDGVERMERIRADMLSRGEALKREGRNATGTLNIGIGAEEFCRTGELGSERLLSATYIKTSETGEYVTVLRDVDLRLEPVVKDKIDTVPRC